VDYFSKLPVILHHGFHCEFHQLPRQVQGTYHKMKNSSSHCNDGLTAV